GLVADLGTDGIARSMSGQIVGTPGYMSPEQAAGSPIGPPSDWYAVGVILFQVLTGKLPFDGDPHSVLLRKQMGDAPSPHLLVRGIPRALSELCVDLLHRAAERRPNGTEFLKRLRLAIPSGGHGHSANIDLIALASGQARDGGVVGGAAGGAQNTK